MLELNESTFSGAIDADKPVVVDFYATWCGPCRAIAPRFKEWSQTHGEQATFAKVNIDDASKLAVDYDVNSIPTVIVFKGGKESTRWLGLPPEKELLAAIG